MRTFLSVTSSTCLRLEGGEGREGEKEKGTEGGEVRGVEGRVVKERESGEGRVWKGG